MPVQETPPDVEAKSVRHIYGFLKGSVVGLDGIDLTAPILDEPFSTEGDKL